MHIKKIFSIGIGVLFSGAPIAGVLAYNISDFPAPFVVGGTPANNLAIVVGDNAAASDVAGAVDVGIALQAAIVTKSPLMNEEVKTEGDTVAIGSTSDILEINETIGTVRESLTEVDLPMLKGGHIVTNEGATEYNQYLRFSTAGGKVIFGENEKDRVGHYLFYENGEMVFEWELEFEEGLETEVKGDDLEDLEDEDVFILGQPFVIVDTDLLLPEATSTTPGSTALTIELMGGAISAILGENDKDTYVVDGKSYEVEVLVISETSNSGEGRVKFRVNGEITDELEDGETDLLSDGTQIGIRDITTTGKDIQKSTVQFYLGAYKLEFRDRNTSDDTNQSAETKVNQEIVENSNSIIKGKILTSEQGSSSTNFQVKTFEIQNINYRLFADTVLGDIYVPPGSGVREQLSEPEGMLTPAWDIIYQSLTDVSVTSIVFDPAGDDEYDLQFTNQEGIFYDIPLLSNENTAVDFKYGDDDDDLWFCESTNTTLRWVSDGDFFILSNCDNATSDNTCFTHVLKYDSADTTNNKLTFTDLGTGTREITFDNTTRRGDIIVGGVSYTVFVDTLEPYNISVDLTGDSLINEDCAEIGIQGEGLITFQRDTNTNQNTRQGPKAKPADLILEVLLQQVDITLLTLDKEFDEAQSDEALVIPLQSRSNNRIGINKTRILPRASQLFGPFDLQENEKLEQALSAYGVFFEILSPKGTDEAETLTINYPLSQQAVNVLVTGKTLDTKKTEEKQEKTSKLDLTLTKLASEVEDITQWNTIILGGPCANKHAAQLLGNPEQCWNAIPENTALLRIYEHDGRLALLIAGREARNTRVAAQALAQGKLNIIQKSSVEVITGKSLNDVNIGQT